MIARKTMNTRSSFKLPTDWEEVFTVLSGEFDMHDRNSGNTQIAGMKTGDVFHASAGCEHVAHPIGSAYVLVAEQERSVEMSLSALPNWALQGKLMPLIASATPHGPP